MELNSRAAIKKVLEAQQRHEAITYGYHVALNGWDGNALRPLSHLVNAGEITLEEAYVLMLQKWGAGWSHIETVDDLDFYSQRDADRLFDMSAHWVWMFPEIRQAIDWHDEIFENENKDSVILKIDLSDLDCEETTVDFIKDGEPALICSEEIPPESIVEIRKQGLRRG